MTILAINHSLKWVQVSSGGKRYTCPMRDVDGELLFQFNGGWHKVAEYVSEYTSKFCR